MVSSPTLFPPSFRQHEKNSSNSGSINHFLRLLTEELGKEAAAAVEKEGFARYHFNKSASGLSLFISMRMYVTKMYWEHRF